MIICPTCGFGENPDLSRFCAQCAAPLNGALTSTPTDPLLATTAAAPQPTKRVAVQDLTPERGQTLSVDTVLQGHYTVLQKLSEGGMGAVYLAEDTKLFNKLCVVKEMLPFYTTDEERRIAERNFEREARTLAHLRHPGIPEVYDYFVEEGRYYLVMAFVEGKDLGKVLAELGAPLDEEEAARYGLQMARVLDYLAGLNPPVMHRDIKPGNIIVEQSTGQLKLVDFGIARESLGSERQDATGSMIMGTRGYAPPEQFAGQATPTSDIYALGATLHHLLTGQHPLKAAVPFQFPSIRERRPELPASLDALLLEMVRIDASQRPSAQEVRKRFERLSGTQVAQNAFVMRNGVEVYSTGELVQACERSPETGRFHLMQGHMREWYLGQNRHDLAGWADQCVAEAPNEFVALEWFLRGADPALPAPVLKLDEEFIDFGEVERDSSYTLLVPFSNAARGYLVVAAASHVPWLRVETEYAGCYAGEQGQLQVTLDTRGMPEGMHTHEALALAWEDQQLRVPARLTVIWPPGGQLLPEVLDFGPVLEAQAPATRQIALRNTGGSDWVGRIQSDAPWLGVQSGTFRIPSQREMTLPVTVYPHGLALGASQQGRITLISNGGSQVALAAARLVRPWYLGRSRLRRWLAFAAPALLSVAGLAFGMAFLAQMLLARSQAPPGGALSVAVGLAAWVLGLLVAGVFTPAIDELENYHHGGDLALDLPAARFRPSQAAITVIVAAVAGLVIGVSYGRWAAPDGGQRALWALAGLALGALAGWLARLGSSDTLIGTRAVPGLAWLAQRPTALALLRTAAAALSLALLAAMTRGQQAEPSLTLPALAALAGLVVTSDGYPYLPLRLRQWLSWIRPTLLIVLTSTGLYLVAEQIVVGRAAGGQATNITLLAALALAGRLGGAALGVASHDEVGFLWRRELRRIGPLALILLVAASALLWLFNTLLSALGLTNILGISQALTLPLVALLALGLSGQSHLVRGWLERGRKSAGGWLKQYQIPEQAQSLAAFQANPLQRLSPGLLAAAYPPLMLASAVVIAVLSAPLVVLLLGQLLALLVLVAVVGGVLWYAFRRKPTASAVGGGQ